MLTHRVSNGTAWFLTVIFAAHVFAQKPPPPNLAEPVDYIAWVNEHYGRGLAKNAADLYRQALAAYVGDEETEKKVAACLGHEWDVQKLRALDGHFARNERCLELLSQAARTEKWFFRLQAESGCLVEVCAGNPVEQMRRLAKLAVARARRNLVDGNTDAMLADLGTVLSTCRHLQSQPTLIDQLVGIAHGATAYHTLCTVGEHVDDGFDFTPVARFLRKNAGGYPRMEMGIEFDRLTALDLLQRLYRDTNNDGILDQRLAYEESDTRHERPVPHKMELEIRVADELRLISRIAQMNRGLFATEYGAAVQARNARRKFPSTAMVYTHAASWLLEIDYWNAAQLERGFRAERRATEIVIALHACRQANTRWPQTLAEATKGLPDDLRIDPFCGKEFGYRIQDEKPLLYSVGPDGKSDDGRPARHDGKVTTSWIRGTDGDIILWPPLDEETDK